jgi:ketosteroid isomerase-like protein
LLAAFGRDASLSDSLSEIQRFNAAFGHHDIDAVTTLMTDDCVFEDTSPPHGKRHVGQAEVRKAWEELFSSSPTTAFMTEEGIVCGDRATYRWRYQFDGGSIRGVDVFRVADAKVAEKFAYVKG